VHDAATATTLERRLAPLIHERDVLALTDSYLRSKLAGLQQRFVELEAEVMKLNEENRVLAATLVEITDRMKDQTVDELDDTRLTARLEGLDDEIRSSRRRWRVMKSLVKGVVVGSGVEWAKRPDLLEVVLDDEDEVG
jgi:predicted transcriptional regulator